MMDEKTFAGALLGFARKEAGTAEGRARVARALRSTLAAIVLANCPDDTCDGSCSRRSGIALRELSFSLGMAAQHAEALAEAHGVMAPPLRQPRT